MAERSPETDVDPLPPRPELEIITNNAREIHSDTYTIPQQPESANLHLIQQSSSPSSQNDHSAVDTRQDLPSTPLPPYYHFNRLLLEISENITTDTLEKIKFVYKDEIKTRLNEKIANARDLFHILEQRRYIVPESMIHLQGIVMMIEDEDVKKQLMAKIFQHSVEHKAVYFRRSTDEPPNGYRPYQCHIKGVEYFKFDTDKVRNLLYTVASITGIELSEILVDGIQMTNSIYITFLVKDVHYRLFYDLLRKGIPLLSDLNVDMVTFHYVEESEDKTIIDVLSGRKTYMGIPPIRESPEETIQRLNSTIEEVQIQNLDYKKEIEKLSENIQTMFDNVKVDPIVMSKEVQKAIQEALKEGASELIIHRVISLNTQLVESLEKKKSVAMENKLRSELEYVEIELEEYKAKLQVLGGNSSKDGENYPPKLSKNDTRSSKKNQKSDGEANADISNDEDEQTLLESLNDTLRTTESLGYSKAVVDQLVVGNTIYTEYKCKKKSDIEMEMLRWKCRLLQERLSLTDSLLQRTAKGFGFKLDVMVQLERVLESKGNDIPTNKGYMKDILLLVMDLSSKISYDEEQQLTRGLKDNDLTSMVKRDRRFLFLRIFYLENLRCESLILLENFVSQKLFDIKRADLENIWRMRVAPRDPALQIHELLLHALEEGMPNRPVIPGFDDLLEQITSKLSLEERAILRKKLPQGDTCRDCELLPKLFQLNQSKDQEKQDDFWLLVRGILEEIKRGDLFDEFEVKFRRLLKGIKSEVREILRITSSKISRTKRKKLKSQLLDKRFVDEDEILFCLTLEHFEQQNEIGIDEFDSFIKRTLFEIDTALVDEFEKLMVDKGLKGDRLLTTETNVKFQFQEAANDSNKLILDKLAELSAEIKSIKEKQTGSQNSADIFDQPTESWAKGLIDEQFLSNFFKHSVRSGGFDIGKHMSGQRLPENQ